MTVSFPMPLWQYLEHVHQISISVRDNAFDTVYICWIWTKSMYFSFKYKYNFNAVSFFFLCIYPLDNSLNWGSLTTFIFPLLMTTGPVIHVWVNHILILAACAEAAVEPKFNLTGIIYKTGYIDTLMLIMFVIHHVFLYLMLVQRMCICCLKNPVFFLDLVCTVLVDINSLRRYMHAH